MSKNEEYLQHVIDEQLGGIVVESQGFLEILRKKSWTLVPPSESKKSQAIETLYFFTVGWHLFKNNRTIAPIIKSLFYDSHCNIGICAPELTKIEHDRTDDSEPFDEKEKNFIESSIVPALKKIAANPKVSTLIISFPRKREEMRWAARYGNLEHVRTVEGLPEEDTLVKGEIDA